LTDIIQCKLLFDLKGEAKMPKSHRQSEGNFQSFKQWIVVSLVLFVYFLAVLLSYSNRMKAFASDVSSDYFSSHVRTLTESFSSEVYTVNQVSLVAASVLSLEDTVLIEHSYELLQGVVDSSQATYGYVSDSAGNCVDIKGNSFNVWDNPDFGQALTGIQVISDVEDLQGGERMLAFYSPITKNGTVEGVVCLQYPVDRFNLIPNQSDYDGSTVYMLIRSDGVISSLTGIRPKVALNENIFDKLAGTDGAIVQRIRNNIENNKPIQECAVLDSSDIFLNAFPVGISGLYVMEIHSGYYYRVINSRNYADTKDVLVKLFVALVLFLGAVIVLNIINRTVYNKSRIELQNKAETDLLTGLLNKIATEKHIQEFLDGDGKNEPAMLVVLDIDNFKKINDTMGHAFGDHVLATLGVRLKNQFRSSDIIGRIGGDEFIVFLKKIPNEEIRDKEANKLINFFKDFKAGDYVKYSVTSSMGVAMYPEDGGNFEQLYKAADKGVYQSKKNGKNQLTLYSDIK